MVAGEVTCMCPVVKIGRRGASGGEVTYICPVVKTGRRGVVAGEVACMCLPYRDYDQRQHLWVDVDVCAYLKDFVEV